MTVSPRKTSPARSSGSSPERTTAVVFVLPSGPSTSTTGSLPTRPSFAPAGFAAASCARAVASSRSISAAAFASGESGEAGVRSRKNHTISPALTKPSSVRPTRSTMRSPALSCFRTMPPTNAATRYNSSTTDAMTQILIRRVMMTPRVASPLAPLGVSADQLRRQRSELRRAGVERDGEPDVERDREHQRDRRGDGESRSPAVAWSSNVLARRPPMRREVARRPMHSFDLRRCLGGEELQLAAARSAVASLEAEQQTELVHLEHVGEIFGVLTAEQLL